MKSIDIILYHEREVEKEKNEKTKTQEKTKQKLIPSMIINHHNHTNTYHLTSINILSYIHTQ